MFKRALILFLLFFSLFDASAQRELDSLKQLLRKGGHDSYMFNNYLEAGRILFSNNPQEARKYLDTALTIANKLKLQRSIADVYHVYGITYYFESNMDMALQYNLKALNIRKKVKDKEGQSKSFGNIGLIYQVKGDIHACLKYHHLSLALEKELKNKKGIAQTLGNIGNVYMDLGSFDPALEYQFKALKIIEDLNDDQELATTLGNISVIYENLNQLKKAFSFAERSYKLRVKTGNIYGQALSLSNMALLLLKLKEFDKAREHVDESKRLYTKIGNKEGMARSCAIVGDVLSAIGKNEEARSQYLEGMKCYEEIGDPDGQATCYIGLSNTAKTPKEEAQFLNKGLEILRGRGYLSSQVNALKRLYKVYGQMGDFKNAYASQTLYYVLNDSLLRNQGAIEIEKRLLQRDYDQRTLRDSLQMIKQQAASDAKVMEGEAQLKRQRIIRISLITGIIVVACFLLYVFNRLQLIRKQKKEIETEKRIREEQHLLLEEKNKEIVDSINYAWSIQHGMIPSPEKVKEIFTSSFILYLPKDKLSGDFYWVAKVNDKKLGNLRIFTVADCTGHGVPGALVSITGINYLKLGQQLPEVTSPALALNFMNRGFYSLFDQNTSIRDGMDVVLGAIDDNLILHYASAKNPVIIIRNNQVIELKGDKHPIGRFGPETPLPFTDQQFQLEKGDSLYIMSDGYADQFGGPASDSRGSKKFKSAELKKLLLEISAKPLDEQKELLHKTHKAWMGTNEQTDDVTIMGIRV